MMRSFFKTQAFLSACTLGICLTGCDGHQDTPIATGTQLDTETIQITEAKSILKPTKGNQVEGIVSFTSVPGGIRVVADLKGLKPGSHGFHIHEKGDCSAPDASSAGAHFDPTHSQHGAPNSSIRHVGDLGNIEADSSGHAHYDRVDTVISFIGEKNIIGRAVIVHADPDDFKTQPTGNAGGRLACGVIEASK